MRVAFQGERGSFSEEAAQRAFGDRMTPVPCREFRDVGVAVSNGSADYAVLPVENSIAGSVIPAYDVLSSVDVPVLAEITRPIRHSVLAIANAQLSGLRRVLSHPVALAQCSKFFLAQPHIEAVAAYDTAGAAQEVAALADHSVAAIAASSAARLYGLAVLVSDVQDRDDNQTRFYVLGVKHIEWSVAVGSSKTALLLETKNEPGALLAVLEPFARSGVNLTKLESRPGGTPWSYRFFLELDGGLTDDRVAKALEEVRLSATHVRVLGSFPVLEG